MFDDDISVIGCNPSPRARPMNRVKRSLAGARSHEQRRQARAKAAPAQRLPSYPAGIDPRFVDQITATKVYTGPRHY